MRSESPVGAKGVAGNGSTTNSRRVESESPWPAGPGDDDQTRQRLSAMLDGTERIIGGGLQLLGLDRIKASLGDAWPRRREHIFEAASRIISQHLAPQDLLLRVAETQFLIMFSNIDPDRAKLKCGMIAKAISDRFEGESDLSAIEVLSVVKEIDGTVRLQKDRMEDLIAQLMAGEAGNSTSGLAAGGLHASAPPNGITPVLDRSKEDDPFACFEELTVDRVGFEFREMLDPKRQTLSSFRAVPFWIGSLGRRYEDYRLLDAFSGAPGEFIPQLDRRQIEFTVRAMAAYFSKRQRAVFVASVHFYSLAHLPSRMALATLLSRIPSDFAQYLVLSIDGLPEGVPTSRVSEFVATLKPHCRQVMISIGIDAGTIGLTSGTGVYGVTIDASRAFGREGQVIRRINGFAAQAERLGLKVGVRGIRSSSVLLACVAAGLEWIEGPTIGDPWADPPPAARFSWIDWYRTRTAG